MNQSEQNEVLIDTFAELSAWFVEFLPGGTMRELMIWVLKRVDDDETLEAFRRTFQLSHPIASKAMKALTATISSDHQVQQRTLVQSAKPERRTSWALTMAKTTTPFPREFVSRNLEQRANRELIGALLSVSRRLLREYSALRIETKESQELLQAQRSREGDIGPAPLQARHIRMLQRVDPECAAALRALDRFWNIIPSTERDAAELRRTAREFAERLGKDFSIFESVAAMAILREVEGRTFSGQVWEIQPVGAMKKNVPDIELRAGRLVCRIFSGIPTREDTVFRDQLVEIYRQMVDGDEQQKEDYNPDLVLEFAMDGVKRSVWAIADAKWSTPGRHGDQLKGSIKGTGTAYLTAFSKALNLRLGDDGLLEADLMPAVTFFVAGGVAAIAGVPISEPGEIRDTFRTARMPLMVAIPFQSFAPANRRTKGATIIGAWFDRLAQDAHEILHRRIDETTERTPA